MAELARGAYDRLAEQGDIDYRVLDELVGQASGKGVLRAMRQKTAAGRVSVHHRAGPAGDRTAQADPVIPVRIHLAAR